MHRYNTSHTHCTSENSRHNYDQLTQQLATEYVSISFDHLAFSALTPLVGGRNGIRPVKTEWWGAGVVICLERGANLHMAPLMSLPLTVSLIQ